MCLTRDLACGPLHSQTTGTLIIPVLDVPILALMNKITSNKVTTHKSMTFDIAATPLIIRLPKGAEALWDSSFAPDNEAVSHDKRIANIACHFPYIQEERN